MHPINATEETISNAKEKRLTAMLNQEVKEGEDKWVVYDDEHTEVIFFVLFIFIELLFGRFK